MTISDFLFSDNSLNSITIPSYITILGNSAFKNNYLTNITIPSNITYIGQNTFQNNKLNNPITLSTNISYVGTNAFAYNQLANTVDNSYNALITFLGNNQTPTTTTIDTNIFSNNGADTNKQVYIAYAYGKKWASDMQTMTKTTVPNISSFDVSNSNIQLVIQKLSITSLITIDDKSYDRTTNATGIFSLIGVISPDLVFLNGNANFTDKNIGNNKTVNITDLYLSGADSQYYDLTTRSAVASASISKITTTPIVSIDTKTYDTTSKATFKYTLTGILPGDLVDLCGNANFVNSFADTNKTVNIANLSLTNTDSINYQLPYTNLLTSGTINKVYVYFSVPDKIYDNTSIITNYNLDGVYSTDASDVFISGSINFASNKPGYNIPVITNSIILYGQKASNYDAIYLNNNPYNSSLLPLTGNILSKPVNVVSTNLNISGTFVKEYDGTDLFTDAIDISGTVPGDIISISYSNILYDFSNINATQITVYDISLSGRDSIYYKIDTTASFPASIIKRPIDISAVFIKAYDKTTTASTDFIDVSGIVPLDTDLVFVDYINANYSKYDVGDSIVTINGLFLYGPQSFNYSITNTKTTIGTINKKILDISASAISKAYDGNNKVDFTIDLIGILPRDDVYAIGYGYLNNINSGVYDYPNDIFFDYSTLLLYGPKSYNYIIDNNSNLTVNNQIVVGKTTLSISVNVQDKTYDTTTTASVSLTLNTESIINNDDVNVDNTYIANYRTQNAGNNILIDVSNIALYGTNASNYYVNPRLVLNGNIYKKNIDASCSPVIKQYDRTRTANVSIYLDGVLDEYTRPNFLNAVYDTVFAGTNKQVFITGITIFGNTSSNYTLGANMLIVNAIITPKPLTLQLQGRDKMYDTKLNANIDISLSGVYSEDIVKLEYSTALFDTKHVDTNKTINVSGIKLTGIDSDNYTVSSTATTTASISPFLLDNYTFGYVYDKKYVSNRPNDISANVKFYLKLPYNYQSDDVKVNYISATFPNTSPPYSNTSNLDVIVSNMYLSGNTALDYSLNNTTVILSGIYTAISQTPLLLFIADETINKIYDRTRDMSINFIVKDETGIIPSDVNVEYIISYFDTVDAGYNKSIIIDGIYLSGLFARNYSVDISFETTGNILTKQIDVSNYILSKIYDSSAYSNNVKIDLSGVVQEDNLYGIGNLNFYTSNAGNKPITTASMITLSGDDISFNYYLPYDTIDLSGIIYKKPLSVKIAKVYDKTNIINKNDISLNGIIGNEIVSATGIGQYSQAYPSYATAYLNSVQLTGVDASNYDVSSNITNIRSVIYKKPLDAIITKVYDGLNKINSTNIVLNGILPNESVSFSGNGIFLNKYVGNTVSAVLNGNLTGNSKYNYSIKTSGITGKITPKPVSVVVSPITYNGSDIVNMTNLSVKKSLLVSDMNRVSLIKSNQVSNLYYDSSQSGNRYILNASGNLFLNGDLSYNYILYSDVKIDASINKRLINLTTTPKIYDKIYDVSYTYIKLTNTVSGDNIAFNYLNIYTNIINVGNGYVYIDNVNLYGPASPNYTISTTYKIDDITYRLPLTIVVRPLTIGIKPRTYDGTNIAYDTDLFLNNVIFIDDIKFSTNSTYNDSNVGNKNIALRNIILSGKDSNNYSVVKNQDISGIIYKRQVGLTILPRIYDGTKTVYLSDFSINNIVNIDVSNIYITGKGVYNSKNVGDKIASLLDLSLNGSAVSNYDISSILQVNAVIYRLFGLFALTPKIYDTTTNLNMSYVYVKNKVKTDDIRVSGEGFYNDLNVGSRKAILTNLSLYGADFGNYYIDKASQVDASITPHPLSIKVNDKIYDGNTIIKNLSLKNMEKNTIGIYPSDSGKVDISGFLLYNNSIAEKNKLILVSKNLHYVKLIGDASKNYYFFQDTYTTGNIYPKFVNIIPRVSSKIYDSYTTANIVLDISGLVQSDYGMYNAKYGSANYNNNLIGNSKPISVKYIYINGAYPQNYVFDTSLDMIGNIYEKPVNIIATVNTKTYDKLTSAVAQYNIAGLLNEDIVYVNGDASFTNVYVGTNKPVVMTNFVLSGPYSPNYYINYNTIVNGNGNITPISLTPYISTISDKTYDASTITTGTIDLTGILENDVVFANATFTFRNSDAFTNKTVDIQDIYIYGPDASNYTLSYNTLTGNANIYTLQLNLLPYTKIYDGTTYVDVSNIKVNGILNAENISLRGNAVFDTPYIGTNNIQIDNAYLYGDISNNYNVLSTQNISGTITKKPVFIILKDKIYDKTSTIDISNILISGLMNNDLVYVSHISAVYRNTKIGKNIKLDISNIILGGNLSYNYDLSGIDSIYGNIVPKQLFASATVPDKEYDGMKITTATIQITNGILEDDRVGIVSYKSEYDTADVGMNKTVYISNIQLNNNNYYLSDFTSTGNILFNSKISRCQQNSSSQSSCIVYNKNNPNASQTNPNLSRNMKYSNYVNKSSYN